MVGWSHAGVVFYPTTYPRHSVRLDNLHSPSTTPTDRESSRPEEPREPPPASAAAAAAAEAAAAAAWWGAWAFAWEGSGEVRLTRKDQQLRSCWAHVSTP